MKIFLKIVKWILIILGAWTTIGIAVVTGTGIKNAWTKFVNGIVDTSYSVRET